MILIDGADMPLESPATQAELAERVRELSGADTPIYPVGAATGLDYGSLPARPGVAISLTKLDRAIDYPARDLTITVEAGMTLANLRVILAAEGQWLPVDVPDFDRATVGGALAVDVSGPRR